ncbi:MAG: DEAD/DEAH box helicase [Candidatus Eisenbacteria bacterium]
MLHFLNPGLLGKEEAMLQVARTVEGLERLSRGVRPFVLRRTKEQVATDLPSRSELVLECNLTGAQRRFYERLRRHYQASLLERVDRDGWDKSRMQVLEALLRLRQAACHPGLIDATRRSEPSAKLDVLLSRLEELLAEGHKALVFSQFTRFLGIVRAELTARGIVHEYLDGQTRDRADRVRRFQESSDVGVFLISLKAGGVGLNLTAADYVFLLDPWWNPAVEAQAIDRAHRIGQTKPVLAYRVVAHRTVEERILELQASKRALADAVLGSQTRPLTDLSREDLETLLS